MEKRELHYLYGISYLVIVIIALIAFALFEVESLVDKVSFALTITSLVLAVLAIMYTYVAGARQENQLATLINTNQEITSASAEIKDAAAALIGHVAAIPKGLQDINDKITTLSAQDIKQVANAPSAIQAVAEPVQAQSVAVASPPVVGGSDEKSDDETMRFATFISNIPFLGMGILYSFLKACRTDNEIEQQWVDHNYAGGYKFLLGILYGARGAGYIDFKVKSSVIIPIKCSEVFTKTLKSNLERVATVVNEEVKSDLMERIALADKTFTSK